MTVTLPPKLVDALQEQVDSGAWASIDEALEAAVGRLVLSSKEDDSWLMENRDAIRAAIAESEAAEQRGEWCTGEELEARMKLYRAQRDTRAA
jgi:Arc/MetJ-type ribon-helix-helix transcriptional regulator